MKQEERKKKSAGRPAKNNLNASVSLLKQPVTGEVLHHHHVQKIILIAGALFMAFCLVCCGWYNTSQRLDSFRSNDLKYRSLQLKRDSILQQTLSQTDSLYEKQPDFEQSVLEGEDSVQRLVKNLMDAKEREIKELEKKVR